MSKPELLNCQYLEMCKTNFMEQAQIIVQNEYFVNKAHWSTKTMHDLIMQVSYDSSASGLITSGLSTEKAFLISQNNEKLVPYEECFETIYRAHIATNHGSPDNTRSYTRGTIFPFFCIPLIVDLCPFCNKTVIKPNSWQVIIFTLNRSDEFNHILVYRELNTKYLFMRPLAMKSAEEIGIELLQIFLQYGIPNYLEFTMRTDKTMLANLIMKTITIMYPPCEKIKCIYNVNSNQETADIKRISKAISQMLDSHDKNAGSTDTSSWILDCHITQYKLNKSRTVVFNYNGNFVCAGIPFEIFFCNKVNNYTSEDRIDALEWDLDTQYMIDSNKNNEVTSLSNLNVLKELDLYFKATKVRKLQDYSKCPACLKSVTEQFFCRKCNRAFHLICAEITRSCVNNINKFEIECLICLKRSVSA